MGNFVGFRFTPKGHFMQRDSRIGTPFPPLPEVISSRMEEFDVAYLSALESTSPTIARSLEHLRKGKGKQLRPLFVFLVASALGVTEGDERRDDVLNGAISIELLHLASLIHDDVIDESPTRRGEASFYEFLGAHKAILFGDYILSHAFIRALIVGSKSLAVTLADLGRQLSEGELLQEDFSELALTTEEQYYEVISRKTAALVRAAFVVGAETARVEDPTVLDLLKKAAVKIGIAFQIKDDIFDYLPSEGLGKPTGNDLREHKVTLPLIFALSTGTAPAMKGVKLLRKRELEIDDIRFLIDLAHKAGGIAYAEERMNTFIKEAKDLLVQALPDNEYTGALLEVADYIVMRDR